MGFSPGVRFVMDHLRLNPDSSLEDVRARALVEGRRVHASSYRRARIELGLDPGPPTRPGPPEPASTAAAMAPARAHDRATPLDVEALRASVTALVAEHERFRAALEGIREVVRRCS